MTADLDPKVRDRAARAARKAYLRSEAKAAPIERWALAVDAVTKVLETVETPRLRARVDELTAALTDALAVFDVAAGYEVMATEEYHRRLANARWWAAAVEEAK
jgi:hypothetical protein